MLYVTNGTVNMDTIWICTSPRDDDIIGMNDIIFKLMSHTRHPTDTNNPHAVTLEQARSTSNTVSGDVVFTSGTVKHLHDTVVDSDASNKKYVDDQKLHMIDPRTAAVNVVYIVGGPLDGFVSAVHYTNGEKKEINYDYETKNVKSVKYTTSTSVVVKVINYDGNGRVVSTSV